MNMHSRSRRSLHTLAATALVAVMGVVLWIGFRFVVEPIYFSAMRGGDLIAIAMSREHWLRCVSAAIETFHVQSGEWPRNNSDLFLVAPELQSVLGRVPSATPYSIVVQYEILGVGDSNDILVDDPGIQWKGSRGVRNSPTTVDPFRRVITNDGRVRRWGTLEDVGQQPPGSWPYDVPCN